MHITNTSHVSSVDLFCSEVFCSWDVFPLASELTLFIFGMYDVLGEEKDYILSCQDRSSVVWKQVVFSPRVGFNNVISVWANREKHVKRIDPRRGVLQESKRQLSHVLSQLTFRSVFLSSLLSSSLIRPRSWLLFFSVLGRARCSCCSLPFCQWEMEDCPDIQAAHLKTLGVRHAKKGFTHANRTESYSIVDRFSKGAKPIAIHHCF